MRGNEFEIGFSAGEAGNPLARPFGVAYKVTPIVSEHASDLLARNHRRAADRQLGKELKTGKQVIALGHDKFSKADAAKLKKEGIVHPERAYARATKAYDVAYEKAKAWRNNHISLDAVKEHADRLNHQWAVAKTPEQRARIKAQRARVNGAVQWLGKHYKAQDARLATYYLTAEGHRNHTIDTSLADGTISASESKVLSSPAYQATLQTRIADIRDHLTGAKGKYASDQLNVDALKDPILVAGAKGITGDDGDGKFTSIFEMKQARDLVTKDITERRAAGIGGIKELDAKRSALEIAIGQRRMTEARDIGALHRAIEARGVLEARKQYVSDQLKLQQDYALTHTGADIAKIITETQSQLDSISKLGDEVNGTIGTLQKELDMGTVRAYGITPGQGFTSFTPDGH